MYWVTEWVMAGGIGGGSWNPYIHILGFWAVKTAGIGAILHNKTFLCANLHNKLVVPII